MKDTGSGIDEDKLSKLSKAFQTFSSSNNANKEGIGLGLFNISKFIRLMGDENQVLSVKNLSNGGASFVFCVLVEVNDRKKLEDLVD